MTARTNGRLPDFVVIGATKCGTTSLFDWLSAHPDIWMAPKELRFFTAEHNWRHGLDWYRGQFAAVPRGACAGEMSNAYSRDPIYFGAASRMAAHLPGARLVYLVRDPLKRLESHYRHRLVTGVEWRSPEVALADDPRYLAASLYGHQLACYRAHYPAERILVLRGEALFADPATALAQLGAFLGIDPGTAPAFVARNVTGERLVAPFPVRRLAAWGLETRRVKRLARRLARSPARRLLARADQPRFAVGEALRAQLVARLETDRMLLRRLAGEEVADWSFDAAEAA